jgi:hypothetical protein
LRRVSPDATPALEHAFNEDERGCLRGELPRREAVVSGDLTVPAAYRSPDAIDFYLQPVPEGLWKNEVTLRSTRAARMYEPGIWVSRVSPTPLLMIVARDDKLTIADLALAAYERALDGLHERTISSPTFIGLAPLNFRRERCFSGGSLSNASSNAQPRRCSQSCCDTAKLPPPIRRGNTESSMIGIDPGRQICPPCVCPLSNRLKSA